MRALALSAYLFTSCLGAEVYAPRFSQVTSGSDFYNPWKIQDLDGNELPDLLTFSENGDNDGKGVIIKNLGNRSFAPPTISHFGETQGNHVDGDTKYLQLDDDPELELFFCATDRNTLKHTPAMIDQGKAGQYGQRIPLAAESAGFWNPIDLDGDARPEFLSSPPSGSDVSYLTLWARNPDGSYTSTNLPVDGEIGSFDFVSAEDLDDDGDLDLLLSNYDEMWVVERTGARTFATVSGPFDPVGLRRPVLTDLDGDGLPDMHSISSGSELRWRSNMGGLSFGPLKNLSAIIPAFDDWSIVKIESISGSPAIIHLAWQNEMTTHLKSLRFGTWEVTSEFTISATSLNPSAGNYPRVLGLEDLDKDGNLDLTLFVSAQNNTKSLESHITFIRPAVAWGTSIGFETPAFIDPTPLTHQTTLIDDFNGDDSKDLILGPDTMGRFALLSNTGDGNFTPPVFLTEIAPPAGSPKGTFITSVHSADFNGDSIPDLAVDYAALVLYQYRTANGIAFGNGDGTFSPPSLPTGSFDTITNGALNISQLIDWDRDGDLDAICDRVLRENLGGYFSSEIRPLIEGGYASDSFGNPITIDYTVAGDVDGDGFPDIIALAYDTTPSSGGIIGSLAFDAKMGIGYNDGNGGIGSIVVVPINLMSMDLFGNPVTGGLLLADMNADGLLDLCTSEFVSTDLFGNPVGTSRWRRNPGGGSRNPANWARLPLGLPGSPMPYGPKLDFNGDGTLEWVSSTGYLRPTPQGPVISPTYNFTGKAYFGYNTATFAEDFDGDGDADFLIGSNITSLVLVKNPTVDERSAITRYLVKAGVKGNKAGPTADADGDGRSNETELLFGTDPSSADAQAGNSLAVNLAYQTGGSSLAFRKPAYADELNLQYQVEHSTNLEDWTTVDGVNPTRLSKDSMWERFTLPLSCSGPCGFYRITGSHQIDPE